MQYIPDASGESLIPFTCKTVELGTTVQTGGWGGYNQLKENGYLHQIVTGSAINNYYDLL
jgi:hypothetical protein